MCGRYAATKRPDQLVEEFEIDVVGARPLAPDYNVAPTKAVYAVIARQPARPFGSEMAGALDLEASDQAPAASEPSYQAPAASEPSDQAIRELQVVRWGLIPSCAKDPAIGSRLINARVESVAEKPAFRRAFAARRCLVPADGYYEWYRPTQPGAKKQPFYITRSDGATLPMAGLYELWRNPDADPADPEAVRTTITLITTAASSQVSGIHDRMPVLIDRDHWTAWLDPTLNNASEVLDVLAELTPISLAAVPVSTAVNRTSNNGPSLIVPFVALDEPALF
ncbi:MAG: SOS response-associated peptidase [Actinomycetes bacterium]